MMRSLLGAMLGLVFWAASVAAQTPAENTGDQIRISYGEPKNPAHRPILFFDITLDIMCSNSSFPLLSKCLCFNKILANLLKLSRAKH